MPQEQAQAQYLVVDEPLRRAEVRRAGELLQHRELEARERAAFLRDQLNDVSRELDQIKVQRADSQIYVNIEDAWKTITDLGYKCQIMYNENVVLVTCPQKEVVTPKKYVMDGEDAAEDNLAVAKTATPLLHITITNSVYERYRVYRNVKLFCVEKSRPEQGKFVKYPHPTVYDTGLCCWGYIHEMDENGHVRSRNMDNRIADAYKARNWSRLISLCEQYLTCTPQRQILDSYKVNKNVAPMYANAVLVKDYDAAQEKRKALEAREMARLRTQQKGVEIDAKAGPGHTYTPEEKVVEGIEEGAQEAEEAEIENLGEDDRRVLDEILAAANGEEQQQPVVVEHLDVPQVDEEDDDIDF